MKTIFFLVLCNYYISVLFAAIHPDIGLNFIQRVKRHGYSVEVHQVTTEDNYILCIYRIPYGIHKSSRSSGNKSAVLFVHGMGGSPNNWILFGARDSFAYYVADRGFDVWVMATRGVEVPLPKMHKKYNWIDDPDYWDYSLHDIGIYDLPAVIDYITEYTKQEKIFFIGHSAACPEFFIMMSEKPQYNRKIKISALYSSSPILNKIDYPVVIATTSVIDIMKGVVKYLDMKEFFPQFRIINDMSKVMCLYKSYVKACRHVADSIGSHKSRLLEDELIPLIASESLGRLSSRQVFQFLDNVKYGEFRKFNYGPKINKKLYGYTIPPKYNLSNCRAAVAFFYGPKDSFCVKEDLYQSMSELPNVILDYEVPYSEFTHTDLLFGRNSTYLVYEPTIQLFKNYDKGKIPSKITRNYVPSP
ncbi:lipase 3-like [Rhynchophorus ferrugineus]|uniref:lipase 3-like n=1 Tax=Rhynchophorus ferrugineus TaxID=354439 RepID=UPI003FCD8C43